MLFADQIRDKGDYSHPQVAQRFRQGRTSGIPNRSYIHENPPSAILIDRGLLLLPTYSLLPKPLVVTTKLQQTQFQLQQHQIQKV